MPSTTAANSSKRRAENGSEASKPSRNSNSNTDKEKATSNNGKIKPETFVTERENFLAAFEKPRQIYKFLRNRFTERPIFLQRTLSYKMQFATNPKRKSRKSFKVNDLLERVESQQEADAAARAKVKFLNFILSGFKETDRWKEDTVVHVKLKVGKASCRKVKRKSNQSARLQMVFEESKDIVIKREPLQECPFVVIPDSIFSAENGDALSELHLFIKVSFPASALKKTAIDGLGDGVRILTENRVKNGNGKITQSSLHLNNCGSGDGKTLKNNTTRENGEPKAKKLKLEETDKDIIYFVGHLTLFDKDIALKLEDFDYDVYLKPYIYEGTTKKVGTGWVTMPEKVNGFKPSLETKELKVILGVSLRVSSERLTTKSVVPRPKPLCSMKNISYSNGNYEESISSEASREAVAGSLCGSEVDHKPVIYQFLYNGSGQQTEARDDLRCPWCGLNCWNLYPLLKHLKLCHPRFSFTYVPLKGGHRIDVSVNKSFDGSYSGSAFDMISHPPGDAFGNNGLSRRTNIFSILVSHPQRPKPSLDEFKQHDDDKEPEHRRTYITGHNRLYHHTTTSLPIHPKEVDGDSEGEYDPEWLKAKTSMMIDEFTDVNEGEKELMKLWNLHVLKHNYVGDCQILLACLNFVEAQGREIIKKNLYRNFLVHLTSLCDFHLLDAAGMFRIIKQLHCQMKETKGFNDLRSTWSEHQGQGFSFRR